MYRDAGRFTRKIALRYMGPVWSTAPSRNPRRLGLVVIVRWYGMGVKAAWGEACGGLFSRG